MATKKPIKSGTTKVQNPKSVQTVKATVQTVESGSSEETQNMVRRKEMVERIVARSGLKPNAIKSVLDAVLQEMGDALSAGEGLNLHPFGKVTVNRQKRTGGKEVLNCKIRRKLAADIEPQPMETAAE